MDNSARDTAARPAAPDADWRPPLGPSLADVLDSAPGAAAASPLEFEQHIVLHAAASSQEHPMNRKVRLLHAGGTVAMPDFPRHPWPRAY